jgi:hypothetical protein
LENGAPVGRIRKPDGLAAATRIAPLGPPRVWGRWGATVDAGINGRI